MATVQQRIEYLIGSLTGVSSELQQAITDSVAEVIGDLPQGSLTTLWEELTDPDGTTGVTTSAHIIIEARKGLYKALQVSPSFRTSESPTASSPVYYTWQGKSYVLPSGGTVLGIKTPAVLVTDETVTDVPDDLLKLFVLRAAINMLQVLSSDKRELVATSLSLPSAPTPPSAPSISYTDATAVAPSAVSIAALPSAPVYSAPSLATKETKPTISALDLTKKADGTTNTPPTAPSTPSLSSAGQATVSVDLSASNLLAPTYSKPSFGGNVGDIVSALPSVVDLSTLIDGATSLVAPTAPGAPSLSSAGQASVTVDMTIPDANEPAFTKITATENLSFTDWDTYFDGSDTGEDPEMMGEVIRKAGVELQEIQTKLNDNQIDFNKSVETYRARVQTALKNAEIAAREAENELSSEDAMALQAYVQGLARYDRQLAQYEADANVQIKEMQAGLERAITGIATAQKIYVDVYTADIQNELNEYQSAVELYRGTLQADIENARIALQEAANELSATDAMTLQTYVQSLSLYDLNTKMYALEVETTVRQYTEKLQLDLRLFEASAGIDISRYQSEVQNAANAFKQSLAVYEKTVERNNLQAQIARQEAQQTAAQSTEVDVVNQARTVDAALGEYQQQVARFAGQVNLYAQEVVSATVGAEQGRRGVRETNRLLEREQMRLEARYTAQRRGYIGKYTHRRPINIAHHDF